MKQLCLVVLATLAGCTTFDSIERNVCGNGILEPGEDCDSSAANCVACAVTCTAATDCPNAGYACGVDHVCHAPSGVLAPATAPSLFLVDDFRVSDIDDDGIGDVLGASKTSLQVRFGDAHGALTSQLGVVTPSETTPAAFADLDGDGAIDAAFGSPDGIAAYESPFGAPEPAVSFQALVVSGATPDFRALVGILPDTVLGFVPDMNGIMFSEAVQFATTTAASTNPLCGIAASEFSPDHLDVYVVTPNAATTAAVDVVLSELSDGATRHLCVQSIHFDAADLTTGIRAAHFNTLVAAGGVPVHKPVWANVDLDNDPCPSLLNSDGGAAALTEWAGATVPAGGPNNPAHCGIGASRALPVMPSDVPSDAIAVGRVLIAPGVPLIGGDALVMTSGVYLYTLNASLQTIFAEVYPSATKLSRVAIGDFNGDGNMDAVLGNEQDSGLLVLYRAGGSVYPGLVIDSVPTNGAVTALATGDFDGNGTDDIVYAESLLGHEAMTVDYGLPGNTFVSGDAGTFSSVHSIATVHVPDVNDPFAVAGSALVLAGLEDTTQLALTVLIGGPQRTMVSYFDPRQNGDPSKGAPVRGLVGGDFSGSDVAPYKDLIAFVSQSGGVVSTGAPSVTAYRLDGTADGLDPSMDALDTGHGAQVTGLQDCSNGVPSTTYPCINDAMLLPWTIGTRHDVVIGIDRQTAKAFSFDPSTLKPRPSTNTVSDASSLLSSTIVPVGAVALSSHAVDMNGDGTSELVVAFAPPASAAASGNGAVEVCQIASGTNAITVGTCSEITGAITAVAPGVTCVDAARGHFAATDPTTTPGTSDEIVVLCHDPTTADSLLARVSFDGSGYHAVVIASGLGPLRAIQVGDVTGDGVDDVVAIRGDAGARSLTILAQCDSRDLACQQTGVAP